MKILYISIVRHPLTGQPQEITINNTLHYPSEVHYDALTHFTPLPTSSVRFISVHLSLMSIHIYVKQLADRQLITVYVVSLLFFCQE